MKTYKNHSEVCKAFLSQKSINGQASNLYFIDGTLYSYGRHYELAILFNDFILVNSNSYSNSTNKHQSKLLHEVVKSGLKYFILKLDKNKFDKDNLDSFIEVNKTHLQNLLDLQIKARKNRSYLKSFHLYLIELNKFICKIHCDYPFKFVRNVDFTNYNEAVFKFNQLVQ
jgi:hypothetical protein